MDPVADTAGEALDEKRQRTTTSITAAVAVVPWAFILAEILGVVLRFLPCLADRAAVRSVCRHWRAASQGHSLPRPLPLLVLPRFRFFSFSTHGAVVAMRRGWMPQEVSTGHVGCVGSSQGWLLVARPCEDGTESERFLVNAFSHEIVCLPRLRAPYCTTSGELPWIANDDPKYSGSLDHVVLSAPPGSATKCIVAGFSYRSPAPSLPGLTLWQPGMKTWYVYQSDWVAWMSDLVFHQGKLYMLNRSWYAFQSPLLLAFTLGEDEHGVNVSGFERPVTMPPIPRPGPTLWARCNLVLWRGSLVLIIRYVEGCVSPFQTEKVDVFALDLSINPCGVTEIHSFDGDCVFVDPCRCTSFPAGSYDGVQGDCIYFIEKYQKGDDDEPSYMTTVYNMRDGTVKPFTAELLSGNPAEDNLADPVWMFPPE
ncbi:hypothetical protein SORBI_3005G171700 [Sorghum bicolor]|uniref:KIB1-4 beta-propeller domain-containing protein n=1 Tax=Sorghum bicolor TaxID=4558 RepID=A0A1B6PT22_SORBI|nr:hypothetical protein SORBI_3005G171700 [Sorghum bicolor]